jgi:hypothetical protein
VIRTIEEVRERYKTLSEKASFLDFSTEVLGPFLPEGWKEGHEDNVKDYPLTEEFVRAEAVKYLDFAFGKALDHRGISAGRSVQKMKEYCWLLGLDEAVAFAENDENYPNYGVPVLKHVAKALGVPLPADIAKWEDGMMCNPHCEEGCGQ